MSPGATDFWLMPNRANALNDKRHVSVSRRTQHIALGGVAVYPALPSEKQAVEMTEYGKHGKP
jgi:hypothetical protein